MLLNFPSHGNAKKRLQSYENLATTKNAMKNNWIFFAYALALKVIVKSVQELLGSGGTDDECIKVV